mgnify:CR=1 FL=1|jgi:oxygen-independent coproporphyrinogen-3 oxidase
MYKHLYIHVPFCRSKCAYCAFYSTAGADEALIDRWLDRILDQYWKNVAAQMPETVFIGGGTPTLLPEKQLERLCVACDSRSETTIETNPETLTPGKAAALRDHITRISMGVQSFNPDFRRILGRQTSCKAIKDAVKIIRTMPWQFNIDLIYGIPGQTLEDWQDDLRRAVDCGVNHMSCYNLTLEEGTMLAATSGHDQIVDDELAADMWQMAGEFLSAAGLERYEISNYARPGTECRHNSAVWYGETYLGLGPTACSFDGSKRFAEPPSLESWLAGKPPEEDRIDARMRRNEIFAFGLRTTSGWRRAQWENWDEILADFRRLRLPDGLFEAGEERIRLTPQGLLLWDSVAEACLSM